MSPSNPIDFTYLSDFFNRHRLNHASRLILAALHEKCQRQHGDLPRWQQALNDLPSINQAWLKVTDNAINLTGASQTSTTELREKLMAFKPWRKGPFRFLEIDIDTEWDSLAKWQRILDLDIDFNNKTVLDIGCGNGAFLWPIAEKKAKCVVGIDPMWLFYHQFMVFQRYAKCPSIAFLPLGIEQIPTLALFDTVLSMGVLYHRKSPLDHLLHIKQLLKPNGELILETIVLPDRQNTLLTPKDRYAGMRNVWMIPSVSVLIDWLLKTGFSVIQHSPLCKTTLDEQRQTPWMDFYSLNQFLDKHNDALTVEGHPAPYRVIIHAKID
ncbi:tRNA 5-methoxyuridine(34)/uridine 5-oxyacetic acid(34) synthase CmoB [Ostreibacterium oceani]|nr:tRNA 5-methoxyuridine(34)/uridine 5-oxyacetic acid(34) synthase CmoB [Ostreibacterium oceani]